MLVVSLIMTFLIGSIFLMLWFGYRTAEEERAAASKTTEPLQALDGPHFFANLGPEMTADPTTIAPAVLIQDLEDHVRREKQVVAEFVNEPSMERLFPDAAGLADALARDLEHRIRHDIAATRSFFADPSAERLLLDLEVSVA